MIIDLSKEEMKLILDMIEFFEQKKIISDLNKDDPKIVRSIKMKLKGILK